MQRIALNLQSMRHLNCGTGQFDLHLANNLLAQCPNDKQLLIRTVANRMCEFEGRVPSENLLTAHRWQNRKFFKSWQRTIDRIVPWNHSAVGGPIDLWHTTNQEIRYRAPAIAIRELLTIHDLNFLRTEPKRRIKSKLARLQTAIDRCDAVSTISNHSAEDIRKHLNLNEKPFRVIYNGPCCRPEDGARSRPTKITSDKSILLALGRVQPSKNIETLLPFVQRLPEFQLVIAGDDRSDYATYLRSLVEDLGIGHRVLFTGNVSAEERRWLYQNCLALLHPSKSEGFGLPVVEAMLRGKPVFVNQATSLPEVAGDVGFYWNDFDPDAMAGVFVNGLNQYRNDPELFHQRSIEHAKKFSWKTASKQFLNFYDEILQLPSKSQHTTA